MGSATLRNLLGTYVSQLYPSTVNDPSSSMYVRNWTGQTCYAYAYWGRPFPLGATITRATLYLTFAPKPISGTLSVTASRLKETAKFSRMTYNNRPTSIYAGSAAVGTLTGTWTGANTMAIDITAQMQAVADGDKWYGYRLTSTWSNTAYSPKFASPQSVTPSHRPYVEIEWSDAPDKPTSLAPAGGHIVSTATPILRFDYTDVSGSTDLAGCQVQVGLSATFNSPSYDSGQVAADSPQFDLTDSGWAATEGVTSYWRVRVQDGAGLWSSWSAAASFKYKPLPTVTLINPAPGPDFDSEISDPTPPIIWESVGQTAYSVDVWADNQPPLPVYRSQSFKLALPGTVMQCSFRDEATGEWYVTQAMNGTTVNRESVVITHTDAKGNYLDKMILVDAGHGTRFGVQHDGADTYFWTQWRSYATPDDTSMSDRDIYRFPYQPGRQLQVTDPTVQKMIDNPLSTNMVIFTDQTNDRAVLTSGGYHRLYAFSDIVANGTAATQIGVSLGDFGYDDISQGATVWKDILFRYNGSYDQTDTPMLRAYSFTTGELLWAVDVSSLGGMARGMAEPEGIYATAGAEGKPAIFLGMSEWAKGSKVKTSSVYAMDVGELDAVASTYDPVQVWDTGKIKGTAQSRTVPAGKITRAGRYSVHVQVWDDEDREAVPNGHSYTDVYQRFTYRSDPTVDTVDTVETDPLDPLPGIRLIWTRTEAPDSFTILRDGDVMVSGISPSDPDYTATVGDLRWFWIDRFPVKNTEHVYTVQAVVNGKASGKNLTAAGVNSIRGTWIVDDTEVGSSPLTVPLVNDKERVMEYGEQSEMYEVLGASNVSLVTQTLRGYQGQINGEIRSVPGVDGSVGYWVRRMLALKAIPGRRVWLLLQDMTFPVVLQNVQVSRKPEADEVWSVSFQFYQQGNLNYTPKL